MRSDIQIVLAGVLPLTANGALVLRKEPPFRVLTREWGGWAAFSHVDLERDVPHIKRVLDLMAVHPGEKTPMIIGYKGRWITGEFHCLCREPIHRGNRYTFAAARYSWSTPCRLGDVRRRRAA